MMVFKYINKGIAPFVKMSSLFSLDGAYAAAYIFSTSRILRYIDSNILIEYNYIVLSTAYFLVILLDVFLTNTIGQSAVGTVSAGVMWLHVLRK